MNRAVRKFIKFQVLCAKWYEQNRNQFLGFVFENIERFLTPYNLVKIKLRCLRFQNENSLLKYLAEFHQKPLNHKIRKD
jgi:hypothetical protein